MKWKDFKKIIDAQIDDDIEISYIDSDMYEPTVHFGTHNDDYEDHRKMKNYVYID